MNIVNSENVRFFINDFQKLDHRQRDCVNILSKLIKQYAEYVLKNYVGETNLHTTENQQKNSNLNDSLKNSL